MLALVEGPLEGAGASEFLRVVLALRAVAFDVTLLEAGAGVGALGAARTRDDDDVGPLLDALAAEGIVRGSAADLPGAIADAASVFVWSRPARSGTPPVLRLSRGEAPSKEALAAIPQAGQVVLA